MRILKYIFLLLLLSLVALTIFVATQKGDFVIERSKIINSPKSEVYNYVNDYKNWEDWGSWVKEDPEMKINFTKNTIGKGGSYSWIGKDGNGTMQTVFVKENDSISQKMNYNGTFSDVFWSFKDTLGGTKVTWKTKGKMGFVFKIYTALNGGVEKVIGGMYEKSLTNLDKALDYEMNTYSIKVNGLVKKLESYYLKQTFSSKISSLTRNTRIVFAKITDFCNKNKIAISGKPFVIFHTYDPIAGITKISACIPIKEEIFTSPQSDILSGKLDPFQAIKTTLTGDYSHNVKALDKTNEYIIANHFIKNTKFSHLELYTIGKNEINNPSKWKTEIYIPIWPKNTVKKISVITPITPEVVPSPEEESKPSEF